jgi:hypothetical protein
MYWARLVLVALFITGPPVAYLVILAIRARVLDKRARAWRPTVAQLVARIQAERDQSAHHGKSEPPAAGDECGELPAGWHWPTRDQDLL